MSELKERWIQKAIKRKGALRKQLGAKDDEKLSYNEIEEASRKGGKLAKRASLALTLRRFHSSR